MPNSDNSYDYDVIVIGGALSGTATALLSKRMSPGLRILVVEKSLELGRRVGESTVEISSFFLGKVLGLSDYLLEHHFFKQGLRFWFHNEAGQCPDSCSEIGPLYNVRLASYQIDRAKLDEHLLGECLRQGIEVARPAEVLAYELNSGGAQQVRLRRDGEEQNLNCRWLVDASGINRMMARKEGWVVPNESHPIASAWARWTGVKSWDDPELRKRYPQFAKRVFALRQPATNHLLGKGWWAWWIPLKGGDMSIGVVYDERMVDLSGEGSIGDKLKRLLMEHPLTGILLKDAAVVEKDVHWRKNLPWHSKSFVGDGYALVGDAAGFIDPFYSPGIDWLGFSAYHAADLISRERKGSEAVQSLVDRGNELFSTSYHRWFEAIYENKYSYMGDWELMRLAFRLDVGLYYLGVVSQPYKYGEKSFRTPPFSGPYTRFPAWFIRFYNRRLAKIGRKRMERGTWGRRNHGEYYPFKSFGLDKSLPLRVLAAVGSWWWLELREGWRSWGVKL